MKGLSRLMNQPLGRLAHAISSSRTMILTDVAEQKLSALSYINFLRRDRRF
jgi:hypothetical protein